MAKTLVENETLRLEGPPHRILGSGAFGTVFVARYLCGDGAWRPCALKVLASEDAAAVDAELDALAALPPHPNIVRLIGKSCSAAGKKVGIATELLAGGSLHARLDEASRLGAPPPAEARLRWTDNVAAGLEVMHERGLVHGDVKSSNAVFDGAGPAAVLKLIDFGLVKAGEASFAGTLNHAAPELIPHSGRASVRTTKADVYAWACLAYSVFSRREPFHEVLREFGTSTSKRLMLTREKDAAKLGVVGALLRGDGGRKPLRPNLDDLEGAFTPPELPRLLERCWQTDHAARPTIAEVRASLATMMGAATSPAAAPSFIQQHIAMARMLLDRKKQELADCSALCGELKHRVEERVSDASVSAMTHKTLSVLEAQLGTLAKRGAQLEASLVKLQLPK